MRIALGWGIVSMLMAWVQEPWQFHSLRFLLGAFQTGLQPGVILYLTFWPPAHRVEMPWPSLCPTRRCH